MTLDYTIYSTILYIHGIHRAPQAEKFWEGGSPKIGSFSKLGEVRGGVFFSQKMIVRTCGETHSVIDSMLAFGSVCLANKNDILDLS